MTDKKQTRQFGLWDSPITPISLARGMRISDAAWDDSGALVWLESRSDRNILVVQPPDGGAVRDLNDSFSVRAKVGYGGGDFTVGQGYVYFIDSESRRIYRQSIEAGLPEPVTPAFGSSASPVLSPNRRWLLYVHSYEGQDVLAVVDTSGKSWPRKLVSGADFYMQPTWHPDGDRIAWVEWDHPNMPWDGTSLRIAVFQNTDDSMPDAADISIIAGDKDTSIFQPEFSPDGRYLAYVSDSSGWWQLYLYDLENKEHIPVTSDKAEHGIPAWIQGMRTYGFGHDGMHLYFQRIQDASVSLWKYDIVGACERQLKLLDGYSYLEQINIGAEKFVLVASGGRIPTRLVSGSLSQGADDLLLKIIRRARSEQLPEETYTVPRSITWPGKDGEQVHGIYYPPQSDTFGGMGKPPLIVKIHGGPTSQRFNQFDVSNQFFATRGYSVLDVNYRGSTGYGRAYRDKLRGNWGIYDVQDAVSGAQHLVDQGQVDGSKLVIMGGSAGGYTVYKALQDYPGFFKAGISLYGVTNHFTLAADTHKFEARYLDSLIGPLPEASDHYRERSPIFFADRIVDPVAVFQGEDDLVVPHDQSDEIVDSLRRRGIPHVYHLYPGEGHGFRKEETIEHLFKEIDSFLRQHVIFS